MNRTSVKKPRVLVVDDNAAFCDNLTEIMAGAGYASRVALTCEAARETCREGFDVALVDLRLPDGDGAALAGQLTELSPDAEVVILTGHATVESATAAVRAGACAYLVKPCGTAELLLTLEQALRKVQLKQEKRDLARRVQVAEKLAAVGTLTAGLSHEIRNPLNAAALQLSVLERRVMKLPHEVKAPLMGPLSLVREEIRRLDHTLEDFLQFARPKELLRQPVALTALAAGVLDFLSGQAANQGVRLEHDFEQEFWVLGDENRLRQVLMNLILNALDAAAQSGWVKVAIQALGPACVDIRVEDSGPGVPLELRGRIFEPFFTTKATGSGLGLSIVHAIVTQHEGTLTFEGGADAVSRFMVRLPATHVLRPEEAEAAKASPLSL